MKEVGRAIEADMLDMGLFGLFRRVCEVRFYLLFAEPMHELAGCFRCGELVVVLFGCVEVDLCIEG